MSSHARCYLVATLIPLAACLTEDDPFGRGDGTGPDTGEWSTPNLDLPSIHRGTNILVIQADALRRDHLPMYGYGRDTLPSLAKRPWWVVQGAQSSASWTPPSVASLMTGLDVHEHGLLTALPGQDSVLYPVVAPTFAEHLSDQGYTTGLFTGNYFITSTTGVGRGFEIEVIDPADPGVSNASELVPQLLRWLDGQPPDQPFFAVLHVMDPHQPYSPEYRDRGVWAVQDAIPFDMDGDDDVQGSQLRAALGSSDPEVAAAATRALVDVYDEQLLGMDRALEALLVALESRATLAKTLVVFTADHGENLNDRGEGGYGHMWELHSEFVDLPLMLLHPELEPGTRGCVMGNYDILPSLVESAGLPPLAGTTGRPMQLGCRQSVMSSLYETYDGLAPEQLAARSPRASLRWYCAWDRKIGFDLVQDPGETTPTDPTMIPGVAELDDQLRAAAVAIDEATGLGTCLPAQ